MSGFLIIILMFIVIIGLYVGSYLLNSKTPPPDGVEQIDGCGSCGVVGSGGCSIHSDPNPNDSSKKTINDFNL